MDQNRLYYQLPYVKSFMCTVESCCESGRGTWLVVLNQTGFYPEGGGQPSDTGTLNQILVLSVREKGEVILHELAAPIEPGILAEGVIFWQDRYDNMQQHSGEHILSGLIHSHFGYDNVGFHMGKEEVTMDFNGILTWEDLDRLEDEANGLVYRNLPVRVLYPSQEELETMEYRSKKELTGQVRVVEIPGADRCACCGTHVERTGEIGLIKVIGMIHYKGGVRLSILCGRRALEDYRRCHKDGVAISRSLSARLDQIPQAVEKLKTEIQDRAQENIRMFRQLLELKLQTMPESTDPLLLFEDGLSPIQLRNLATRLYEDQKCSVALVCSGEGREYHYVLGSGLQDMKALSRRMNEQLAGRGGGSSLMAQGTFHAEKEQIREVFEGIWN